MLLSCGDSPDEIPVSPSDIIPLPVLGQPVTSGVPEWVRVPTYDSSGEAVHPDVLFFPSAWAGWEYWMAFTPYPGGDAAYENPSVVVSHDGRQWVEPVGETEPVVPQIPALEGYNSDPDISYVPDSNELVLVYREVVGGENTLKRLATKDGVNWTAPVAIADAPYHALISPSVVYRPGKVPLLWVVDAGSGCTTQETHVVRRRWRGASDLTPKASGSSWTRPVVTNLVQPGYIIWHIDVTYVPSRGEYWAIYPARPVGSTSCLAKNDLFMAWSTDGIFWHTFDNPVVTHGVTPWSSGTLYRSSMLYDEATNMARVWLSARAQTGSWYLGYVEVVMPGGVKPSRTIGGTSSRAPANGPPPMSITLRPRRVGGLRTIRDSFP